MKRPLTLVHLVSGQPLENLLPIMAFAPDRVVQIRSADPRFKRCSRSLREAARHAGLEVKIDDKEIAHRSPDVGRTAEAVAGILPQYREGTILLNLTGGTRLMSMGALRAAGDSCCAFYCDTDERGELVHVCGPPLPAHRPLSEVLARLTVPVVMSAHGVDPATIRSKTPEARQLEFAARLASLRAAPSGDERIGGYLAGVRKRFFHRERFLSGPKLDAALRLPLPPPRHEAERACLAAGRDAGHLREIGPGSFYLGPDPILQNAKRTAHLARSHFEALEGGWWELEVYRLCIEAGAFADLRAEVRSSSRDAAVGGPDLVGIGKRHRALTFVSCKVSDPFVKPLEHAFEFTRRAQQFGGSAARAVFAFHCMRSKDKRDQLDAACRALRSTLLVGPAELAAWLADRA